MSPQAVAPIGFAQLKKGMRVQVVGIKSDAEPLRRIQEMGLTIGTVFRVVKVAPLGDPVEIDVRGYRLCLRRTETQGIEVQPLG